MAGKQLKEAMPAAVRSGITVRFHFSALDLLTVCLVKEGGEEYTESFDSVQHYFSEVGLCWSAVIPQTHRF